MDRAEHLYLKLVEECSEVQHRVLKLLQFGLGEKEPGQNLTNIERLGNEINDVLTVIEMLEDNGYIFIDRANFNEYAKTKMEKINHFRDYSISLGCVEERHDP